MGSLRTLAVLAVCYALCGCELIADFDRGKLDMGTPDSGYTVPPEPTGDDAGSVDEDAGSADEDAGVVN